MENRNKNAKKLFKIIELCSSYRYTLAELMEILNNTGFSVGERQMKRDIAFLVEEMWLFKIESDDCFKYRRNPAM